MPPQKWKRPLFAIVTVVLVFGGVELGLRIAGVPGLLEASDPFRGFSERIKIFELDERQKTYRTPRRAVQHSFNFQEFAADKPVNGLRLFTLGGSTAAGFPWGATTAFTHALGQALQASWPERSVEAVNAAAMSYGSHRMRILTSEILEYEPDVIVIYGGHNEFVERRFYRDLLDRSTELDRFRLWLYGSRIYASLSRLYERIKNASTSRPVDGDAPPARDLLGLDVEREEAIDIGGSEQVQAVATFVENLNAIVDQAEAAGVPVVVCSVASNLKDWLPNQSFFDSSVSVENQRRVGELLSRAAAATERGDLEEAVTALEQARARAPGYALVHFNLGRTYETLGRWDDALRAYESARNTDAKPSRAPSAINEAIRSVAESRNLLLVDVERVFEDTSEHGITGFRLFEDYVHLKPGAHRLVARELWSALLTSGVLGESRTADPAEFVRAVGDPDVTADAEGPLAARSRATPQALYNLGIVLENQGQYDQAMEKYRACIALDPRFYTARYNLGRLLGLAGRFEEAVEEQRKVVQTEPTFAQAYVGMADALQGLGRKLEALEALQRATLADPGSAPAWSGLGTILAEMNRNEEAEQAFRRAAKIDPRNVDTRANLGFTLLFQQKLSEAETEFRECLARRPDHLRGRNGLAAVLTDQGALDDAEKLFRENLLADPDDAFARTGLDVIAQRRAAR